MPVTDRFLVLHALKVKGLASAEDLVEITGSSALAPVLEDLTAEELVTLRTGRVAGYTLTKAGRGAHPALLQANVTDAERTAVARVYDAFLPLNARFKSICTRWQMRPGPDGTDQVNDHADPEHDGRVIADLGAVHDEVTAALDGATPRFARYPARFAAALERVRAGDTAAFARPMSGSYHDVWMELHEDLLLTLGRERAAADGH